MSAGGGGGGTTRYEWNDNIAPYWGGVLQNARNESFQGYQPYGGERVAGLTPDEQAGMGGVRNYVTNPGQFLYGKGNMEYQNTLGGTYLDGAKANPFSTENAYSGVDNPYFKSVLQNGQQSIVDSFQNAVVPQLDSQAIFNGTFGGGDHKRLIERSQQDLAKQLGTYTAGMQNDQYNRSAQLDDSYLARGSSNYENERNRMLQAGAASQADQGLTLDRMNAMLGIGGLQRGITQKVDDTQYQDFFDQKNFNKNQLNWLTSILSSAQGGMAPTQITAPSGSSMGANALGSALAAYGLFRS